MKLFTCPINGTRPISEFIYGGELRHLPDAGALSDEQWADYVFNRSGVAAIKKEWWCHAPSGVWFIAERDTGTDELQCTYLYCGQSTPEASRETVQTR